MVMPLFAKFNFSFNRNIIMNELNSFPKDLFSFNMTYKKQMFSPCDYGGFYVGDVLTNFNTGYFTTNDNGDLINKYGSVDNWKSICLTYIPEEPKSLTHNSGKRVNGEWKKFRLEYPKWTIRDEIKKHMPYTTWLMNQLPFDHFNMSKILILNKDGFGPVHMDEPNSLYRNNGYFTINFTVMDGGRDLFLKHNNRVYRINYDCFAIDNSKPHGVPVVKSQRVTITVEGKINENFTKYFDQEEIVWP